MAYWLLKSDPDTYSWENLQRDQRTRWDGVRNFQARNHLKAMHVGDLAFFYHSQDDREIVGVVRVTKAAYPDPTAESGEDWVCVDIELVQPLMRGLGLDEIKSMPTLGNMELLRQSRLSVQPVRPVEWEAILKMTKTTLPV